MKSLKYIFAAVVLALGFASCGDEEEALIYETYDFMEIKGDSVISRAGLEMVASTIHTDGDWSEVRSEVTVGNNVFNLNFYFVGRAAGLYNVIEGDSLHMGFVKYRAMSKDSTFAVSHYLVRSGNVKWTDVDESTVLLDVNLDAFRYNMADSLLLGYPKVNMKGKIRATIN